MRLCATENTYTPARLEAMFKLSVVLILSHLVRLIRTIRTIQDSLQIFWGCIHKIFGCLCAHNSSPCSRSHRTFLACCLQCRNPILFTQMQICSTLRKLFNFECCCVCPWTSLQSSRRETRCIWCHLCCEPFRLFSECQASEELFDHNGSGCVSAWNVGDLRGVRLIIDTVCWKLLTLRSSFLMSVIVSLIVFRVSIPFCMKKCVHNIYQLSFWFAEIFRFFGFQNRTCSQRDAFWHRLRHACCCLVRFCFGWACAPGSWTDGMLFNTVAILLLSSCQIDLALLASVTSAVFGFRLHLHCLLDHWLLRWQSWHPSFVRLISDRIVSYANCYCETSIFLWTLWIGILISLHSLELLLRHLFSVGQLESSILSPNWILRYLDCIVSSPLGLWNLSLHLHAIVTNLVDELRLEKFSCFLLHLCVFVWEQLHHWDGHFQNRQWHTHIDDLFVDSSKIGSAYNRLRWCSPCRTTCNDQVLCVSSPNPSVDVFPRIVTGSPSCNNWFSFCLWLLCESPLCSSARWNSSHSDFRCRRHSAFCFRSWAVLNVAPCPSGFRCTSSCSPRAVSVVSSRVSLAAELTAIEHLLQAERILHDLLDFLCRCFWAVWLKPIFGMVMFTLFWDASGLTGRLDCCSLTLYLPALRLVSVVVLLVFLACCWLCFFACCWLCSSACCWLCSSRFFSSFLPFSTMSAALRAHRRFNVLLAVLVPMLLYFVLLVTGSLAVVPYLAVALSLILSRDTLW